MLLFTFCSLSYTFPISSGVCLRQVNGAPACMTTLFLCDDKPDGFYTLAQLRPSKFSTYSLDVHKLTAMRPNDRT